MKMTDWKGTAELVGIAAIVGSLIFVGLQMRQAQDIAIAETFLSILDSEIESLNLANESAEVWNKVVNGEDLTDVEATVFSNLINAFHLRDMRARMQLYRLGHTNAAELRSADFASFLHQHPKAREEWERQMKIRDQYRALTKGFVAPFAGEVRSYLEDLDEALK
jgi:hypothetical protein